MGGNSWTRFLQTCGRKHYYDSNVEDHTCEGMRKIDNNRVRTFTAQLGEDGKIYYEPASSDEEEDDEIEEEDRVQLQPNQYDDEESSEEEEPPHRRTGKKQTGKKRGTSESPVPSRGRRISESPVPSRGRRISESPGPSRGRRRPEKEIVEESPEPQRRQPEPQRAAPVELGVVTERWNDATKARLDADLQKLCRMDKNWFMNAQSLEGFYNNYSKKRWITFVDRDTKTLKGTFIYSLISNPKRGFSKDPIPDNVILPPPKNSSSLVLENWQTKLRETALELEALQRTKGAAWKQIFDGGMKPLEAELDVLCLGSGNPDSMKMIKYGLDQMYQAVFEKDKKSSKHPKALHFSLQPAADYSEDRGYRNSDALIRYYSDPNSTINRVLGSGALKAYWLPVDNRNERRVFIAFYGVYKPGEARENIERINQESLLAGSVRKGPKRDRRVQGSRSKTRAPAGRQRTTRA